MKKANKKTKGNQPQNLEEYWKVRDKRGNSNTTKPGKKRTTKPTKPKDNMAQLRKKFK